MLRQELYEKVRSLVEKCNRCGFCRAVCPSLGQLSWESASPRGRIYLAGEVLSGRAPLTSAVVTRLDQCLLCRNCMTACPVGARVDQVIMAFRRLQREVFPLPLVKQMILGAMGRYRNLAGKLVPWASALQQIPFKKQPGNGVVFRLNGKSRVLPLLGGTPLLAQVQAVEAANPVKKVVFFTGCYLNFCGINVGRSVINVLSRNACSVILPPDQLCCGVPFFASGEIDRAVKMVRNNIEILTRVEADAVVYACGSCGTGLKEWSQHPEIGPEWRDRAKALVEKTFEISEFLIDHLGVRELPSLPRQTRVTYHDSCHLAAGGITSQPRRLLGMLGNASYVEMPEAATCCGNAGLFSLTHYPLSRKISEPKIKSILAVDPQVVTSGCPGCNLQIRDGLNRVDHQAAVTHYLELINNAYECAPGGAG